MSTQMTVPKDEIADLRSLNISQADYMALRASIAKEATPAEFRMHLMVCARLGLSPVGGMAHFVKRYGQGGPQWTTQIGIDGFRSMAEESKQYQGPVKGYPKFQYEKGGEWSEDVDVDKAPYAAKFAVWRKGWKDPVEATAYYKQYVQTNADGKPNRRWQQAAHPQLAKCAEALALRLAFPRKLGGIYTVDEMAAVGEEQVAVTVGNAPGEEGKPGALTAEQEAELKALNGKLPSPKEGYTGPTRWTLGKVKAEFKKLGSFEKLRSTLLEELLQSGVVSQSAAAQAAEPESSETIEGEVVQVQETLV